MKRDAIIFPASLALNIKFAGYTVSHYDPQECDRAKYLTGARIVKVMGPSVMRVRYSNVYKNGMDSYAFKKVIVCASVVRSLLSPRYRLLVFYFSDS